MTPEAWVKRIVKEMLDLHPRAYYHLPVQNGMGAPSLDFICCIDGRYVAIETKAPGKRMTERQERTAKDIEAGGGTVISNVGTNWDSLDKLFTGLNTGELLTNERYDRWRRWFDNAVKAAHPAVKVMIGQVAHGCSSAQSTKQ